MSYPRFGRCYSEYDWWVLEQAHKRASKMLGRDPKKHPHANRLARSIMLFFNAGERDFGRLATMGFKREMSLFPAREKPESALQVVVELTDQQGIVH
jgi:hypothetical protein